MYGTPSRWAGQGTVSNSCVSTSPRQSSATINSTRYTRGKAKPVPNLPKGSQESPLLELAKEMEVPRVERGLSVVRESDIIEPVVHRWL